MKEREGLSSPHSSQLRQKTKEMREASSRCNWPSRSRRSRVVRQMLLEKLNATPPRSLHSSQRRAAPQGSQTHLGTWMLKGRGMRSA